MSGFLIYVSLTICLQVMGCRFVPWKTTVLGPPQAVDQRPDEKWREGSAGAPTAAGGASARSRPRAHSPGRGELVSSVGGSGHRMAGLVCPPLWWCCHAGHAQYPALQKRQLGFPVSLYLLPITCHTAPAGTIFRPL